MIKYSDDFVFSDPVTCSEPIEVVSYKIGVCKVSSRGKECATVFQKLGYNERTNTSVVLCKPKTGRMHQIRVHLQYLGKHPSLFLATSVILSKLGQKSGVVSRITRNLGIQTSLVR